MRKKGKLRAVLTIVLLLGISTVARSATITVTTTEDNVAGSLREAITTANCNNENDTIHLPAGTYFLSGTPGEDQNLGGDLDINTGHGISIVGEGAGTTLIDGSGIDRVLHIINGSVTVFGVTIQNGRTPDGSAGNENGGHGGGILNSGRLTLSYCTLGNNATGSGNDGNWPHGGPCGGGNGGKGGAVYNENNLSLNNCSITGNQTGNGGVCTLCLCGGGYGGDGGGIFNSGVLELSDCLINGNSTGDGGNGQDDHCNLAPGGYGGGIYNEGTQNVNNCTISNNKTGIGGFHDGYIGDDVGGGHGGGIYNGGESNIKNSIIKYNTTGSGMLFEKGGDGAGIFNGKTLIITNCTVSGNSTGAGDYWGSGGDGGGIYNHNTMTVTNCTICNNTTGSSGTGDDVPQGEYGMAGCGGGIYNDNGAINIKNTIVADNKTADGGEGPDCYGTLNSLGYNLVRDTGKCTINGTHTGNITGVDPLLVTLSDNGGPTLTHALLPDSPAIDAGDSTGIFIDQRGKPRPVDIASITNVSDGSDIGAFEYDSPAQTTYTISGHITLNGTPFTGVILTFSNNGTTVTDENGDYARQVPAGWSGSVTPAKEGYVFTPPSREYPAMTADRIGQNFAAVNITPSDIVLSRNQLNFSADLSEHQSAAQTVFISSGSGVLNWTAVCDAQWLICTPETGTGNGKVTVSVDITGLGEGTYTGVISVSDPLAANSPQTISVTLNVYSTTGPPFGCFDTPLDGSTVNGSIPVTGWVLDDVEVKSVRIYREDGQSSVFIGEAVRVEGARPDIQEAYPGYPDNFKAGWGYMLLTNALPHGGNGTCTLRADAKDSEGNSITLGKKTITCNNVDAVEPFGAIDTPGQGGTIYTGSYENWGWVLTPQPNTIPTDGSTINVWIDGIAVGHPDYDKYREDIARLFPGYNNSNGPVGVFQLDTGKYADGVHTIAWTATDDAGNSAGFGSRYFSIRNTSGSRDNPSWLPGNGPVNFSSPVLVKRGYNQHAEPVAYYPGDNGMITVEIVELERVVISVGPGCVAPRPIGSAFDAEHGVFYWQPGPGFIGDYLLTFVFTQPSGMQINNNINVLVRIRPKFVVEKEH